MSQYFPKPFNSHFGDSIKVKIDLSNYGTKVDIKNISHVDTSSFALKTNLSSLKAKVDKPNIDCCRLITIPIDLSKLSDVVKNDVVKITVYNKLVAKVDNVDTSDFMLKTKYNTDKTELENKIPDTSGLVKKTSYNTKITELENKIPDTSGLVKKTYYNTKITKLENKIPDISNLATKNAFTAIENKMPNVNLVKKNRL